MIDLIELKNITESFTVLFVEDDKDLVTRMVPIFERLFKSVDTSLNGKEALENYKAYKDDENACYDIVISDIEMPLMDGIELSKSILKINPNQKIIITSAYNDHEYLVDLINIGVSGFFNKPMNGENMFKVLYDVCSLLTGSSTVELGKEILFDTMDKSLIIEGNTIDLTSQEQKLLDLFCKNPNQFFSPVDIFNHVYYDQVEKEFSPDSVRGLIKRLRKKIPKEILCNTPNLGYCLKI